MRNLIATLALTVGMTGCADGCTPTSDGPTADSSTADIVLQDTVVDADGQSSIDTDIAPADAKTDADAEVVIPAVITPCMADPLVDPVVLGEPCTPVGARRCSDLDAVPWPGNYDQLHGPQLNVLNRCKRPYLAECTEVQPGLMKWALRSCSDVRTSPNGAGNCAVEQSCEEIAGTGKCFAEGAHTSSGTFLRCARSQLGMTRCVGSGIYVQICTEAKDGKLVTSMPPWSRTWEYGCNDIVNGGTYWVTAAQCGNELGLGHCPSVPMNTPPYCNYYPDGTARCDKTCDELLKSYKDWGGKP